MSKRECMYKNIKRESVCVCVERGTKFVWAEKKRDGERECVCVWREKKMERMCVCKEKER